MSFQVALGCFTGTFGTTISDVETRVAGELVGRENDDIVVERRRGRGRCARSAYTTTEWRGACCRRRSQMLTGECKIASFYICYLFDRKILKKKDSERFDLNLPFLRLEDKFRH